MHSLPIEVVWWFDIHETHLGFELKLDWLSLLDILQVRMSGCLDTTVNLRPDLACQFH